MPSEFTSTRIGPAGWAEVEFGLRHVAMASTEGGTARVRMRVDPEGMLRVAELSLLDPDPQLLRRVPLSGIEDMLNLEPERSTLISRMGEPNPVDLSAAFPKAGKRAPRIRLERPEGRPTDAFYAAVAHAYRGAVRHGMNPKQALAADSGAPLDTVAGWIKETRRRGLLPPGRPGRRSA